MTTSASTPNTGPETAVHVVVAVIRNTRGEVLVARRPENKPLGGLWEFPGGKLLPDEPAFAGLQREIREELGLEIDSASPLLSFPYDYPGYRVFLDVWQVTDHRGEASGREGQAIRWVAADTLQRHAFPPANAGIITALQLPDRYLVTPEPGREDNWPLFLRQFEASLQQGIRLVQLRSKLLDEAQLDILLQKIQPLLRHYGTRLLLNGTPESARRLGAGGVHLSSSELARQQEKIANEPDFLVAASCHNTKELAHALAVGADFALLSPVQPTQSHPDTPALGWERFSTMIAGSTIPVYALGGMRSEDVERARACGAQGIAAISSLWAGDVRG